MSFGQPGVRTYCAYACLVIEAVERALRQPQHFYRLVDHCEPDPKVVSMVREFSTARAFGTSSQLDVYLVAWVMPTFTIDMLVGAFQFELDPYLPRSP
jgi:hypothetical protein